MFVVCIICISLFLGLQFVRITPQKSSYLFLEMFRYMLYVALWSLACGAVIDLLDFDIDINNKIIIYAIVVAISTYSYGLIVAINVSSSLCASSNKLYLALQPLKAIFGSLIVLMIVFKSDFLVSPLRWLIHRPDLPPNTLEILANIYARAFWPGAAMLPATCAIYLGASTFGCYSVENKNIDGIKQIPVPKLTD